MKSCYWLSLVTRVFIVFTVSPSIIPPLLLFRVLSHFLSSLHFCRLSPFRVSANKGKSGSIWYSRKHFLHVTLKVSSSIALRRDNSSLPKIVSPLLDRPSLPSFFSILEFRHFSYHRHFLYTLYFSNYPIPFLLCSLLHSLYTLSYPRLILFVFLLSVFLLSYIPKYQSA